MKNFALLTCSMAILASSSAFAQETRAQVYQDLSQADRTAEFVTDESYPEISPLFAHTLTEQQRNKAMDVVQKMMKMKMDHQAAMIKMESDYRQSMMQMRLQLMDLYRGG